MIGRDERFGYLELATAGFESPCLASGDPPRDTAPRFIRVSKHGGVVKVALAVEMEFDLASGKSAEWQRLRVANME